MSGSVGWQSSATGSKTSDTHYNNMIKLYKYEIFPPQPNNFQDDELRKREEVNFFFVSIGNLINWWIFFISKSITYWLG